MSKSTRLVNSRPSSKLALSERRCRRSRTSARLSSLEATFSIPVTPRPTNTSLIFPRASTGTPDSWSRSRYVGPGGSNEKSRRSFVRANAPGLPVNGRAMTRATPCGPCRIPRAISHHSYSGLQGHDLHVGGDLEDAVRRGVDDRPSGGHVLGAQFVDDDRAGRRLVAQHAPSDALPERSEHLLGEPVWVGREGPGRHQAHVLPVADRGVLARRERGQAAGEGRRRRPPAARPSWG